MSVALVIVSFIVACVTTRVLIALLRRAGKLDVPNARSSHSEPTPRGGGLGILAGLAAACLAAHAGGMPLPAITLLLGAMLVALIGFVDDLRGGLPAGLRFLLQFAAAALALYGTSGMTQLPLPEPLNLSLGQLAIPAALLWIVAVTNIYNFLDGIDGYAGVQGVVAGTGIGFFGLMVGSPEAQIVGFSIAGACAGFLIYNWHPAKIFMGDVGSGALGFLLAALPFQLAPSVSGRGVFVVALCLWFFLSDGTFTILRRLVRGERVWQAHRSHLYQRLTTTGLNHRRIVLLIGAAAVALGAFTLIASYVELRASAQSGTTSWASWMTLGCAVASFIVYWKWTTSREKHFMEAKETPTLTVDGYKRFMPRRWSRLHVKQLHLVLDLMVLIGAFAVAYLLRFDFDIPPEYVSRALVQMPYVVLLQFAMIIAFGIYNFIWRYIGMAEIKAFIKAALISALPIITLRAGLPTEMQEWRVPLSVTIMSTILGFGGVLGLRIMRRAAYERYEKRPRQARTPQNAKKPVLLIGAGRAGVMTAREIGSRGDFDLEVKGFVDDDREKHGSVIHGVKVLGGINDLPRLVRELSIDHVIISIVRASRSDFRRLLDLCEQIPVKVRIIPGLSDILQGKVKVTRIRDVQIEDLLGREPVRLEEENIKIFLTDKAVMVTGAGGSIGSELAQQVARFKPSSLLLVERAEGALYNIDRELRAAFPELNIITLVADICDEIRMRSIFNRHRPHVVFHAAAHKHVPMMEFNPCEAIKNNVLGTRLLGELAGYFGSEAFVMISTDKAVRPTSVMGAAKRVAELAIQNLNHEYKTRYVAVRFGNVIGSAGSVIPLFREQISKGGPVTVTHPDMVRYFMTIPEAAQLVLQAGAMGKGGEIFVLDMGEPVKIFDLAKDTITLTGLRPFEDVDIIFTGLRPGEKLFEELEMTNEQATKTRHPRIFIGRIAAYPEELVQQALQRLTFFTQNGQEQELRVYLNELLPEARLTVRDEPGESNRGTTGKPAGGLTGNLTNIRNHKPLREGTAA
ncbi:MAG: polysaccharide biosynthesis protein [Pyrinomonadaceae bacterium MAG19_C2-C3]|nr:polysaccharide biosynthesis protein [Pyrinomonadaceae bacterium MAG19_C2-C3]